LSEDDIPCDIPQSMLDNDYPEFALRPWFDLISLDVIRYYNRHQS
jgi:hypothetical protein